ncbi:hypothetical protein DCAR_0934680 [Daucus carota subsp. sativus]|uniref:RING-type domain-containing protein n=1 Tax=Daucus carota subsp. sativus TaxID=79200 RepID=A0AAF1BEI9_DAUCS|nr:hypothetical protein DCAR_0934680 [Daucus carota subsp. sativus]
MELDYAIELQDEDSFGFGDSNVDNSALEGEKCGICMDIVIDRGVLDCCQHWYCFSCIDNWATITNLCPLCQNEFQLITCVPVYDTIGNNSTDEDLDDDWCIEGKNNTLSFPSYYIDENAVVCLDGDGCKVRSMSASVEEGLDFDTSIACDSCDLWYHAFCVGFDTEGTCENSWLCPRCTVQHRSDELLLGRPSNQCASENSSDQCPVDPGLSGKLVVSVADAGETALVVSMLEGKQETKRKFQTMSSVEMCEMKEPWQLSDSVAEAGRKSGTVAVEKTEEQEMTKVFPSSNIPEDVKMHASLPSSFFNKQLSETTMSLKMCEIKAPTQVSDSVADAGRKSATVAVEETEEQERTKVFASSNIPEDVKMHSSLSKNRHSVGPNSVAEVHKLATMKKDANGSLGTKRKNRDWRGTEEVKAKTAKKKVNAEGSMQQIHANDHADECVKKNTPKASGVTVSQNKKIIANSTMQTATTSIMDIVRETDRLAETSSRSRENAAGLRVKKILRRPTEDKESSILVQKLRKEIRDAVRNKTSKELGDNHFDPKLLTAFRAAVVGQVPESKNSLPVDMKAKKSLLQKGKIRENLTKKIYGMGGRRRRAWTRDCDIEFWKYRCSKISKPEKIETLKSVLNLLRKSPERTEIKHKNESAGSSSILSRLYLADSSLFPRKEDIKPVSTLKAAAIAAQNKNVRSTENPLTSGYGNNCLETLVTEVSASQMKVPPPNIAATTSIVPTLKGEVPSHKSKSNRCTVGSSIPTIAASQSQKDPNGKHDMHTDKRKWAQQFLARKAAVAGNNALQEQDDTAVLKGQHPLLAQLPRDMRPVLAVSRHNKIPLSIRQAQLYRLTEHFLRKTNMPVNRRTAQIELAVADAVNIEKEVANRSNSKLVYVNLCSQELLHRSESTLSSKAMESISNPVPEISADRLVKSTIDCSTSLAVDEALRNAGLLSDSPPSSPHRQLEEIEKADDSKRFVHEGPDSVFEIDSEPELDIYGDFEYDLQDEDFIGASTLKGSESQAEEPKLKVVFSTIDSDRPNDTVKLDNIEKPVIAGEPDNSSNCIDSRADTTSTGSLIISGKADRSDPQSSLLDEGEELSLAECEELYGPDREPLITKFPESVCMKPYDLTATNLVPDNNKDNLSSQTLEASDEKKALARNQALTAVVGDVEYESKQSRECVIIKEKTDSRKQQDGCNSVHKKVEAYIKEHIRPLCKSGVINVEQYRWAVGKTTEKIMKYHHKDKNANFLIKEGEKVKKLAEQYVEAAQTQRG